jgi:pimeloyl-ACP methyl ester carboxylesterase
MGVLLRLDTSPPVTYENTLWLVQEIGTMTADVLHHVYTGSGAPVIVFVHGFACSHADWQLQMSYFADHYSVLACDLRGHGASAGAADDCSIETYGADVAGLLAQRNISAAVLVGHSMGCRVVLQATLQAPERVAGLVLIDGSKIGSGDAQAAGQAVRESIAGSGYQNFIGGMFGQMFLDTSPAAIKNEVLARASTLPDEIGSALFPRMVAWDARHMEDALAAVTVPLLVLQSTYLNEQRIRVPIRPGVSTPFLDTVRHYRPDAQIEIVSGVGHFPQLEAAGPVNALIEAFVTHLPGA